MISKYSKISNTACSCLFKGG